MTAPGSLARNVLSNWLVLALNVAYALAMTPIIVRAMGVERYGVWSFLNGLLAYSELLYLGLGSALIKYIAQLRADNDTQGINRLASVVASIYSVMGVVCLVIFTGLSTIVTHLFAEPLSPDIARGAAITCGLLGVRLLMIFVSSAFAGILSGHDRFDLVNAVQLASIALRFILTPVLLGLGRDPLLTVAWLTAGSVAFELTGIAGVAFRWVGDLRLRPTLPEWSEVRWLYSFGLKSFFIVLAVKLISYTDTTVIGMTLGAASVAVYSLPLQLVEYSRAFIGGFAAVFLPRIALSWSQGHHESVGQAYLRSARIATFLAGWLAALLITLGPMFLRLWVGAQFGDNSAFILTCLSIAMLAQVLSSQVPMAFYQALGAMTFPAGIMVVEAGFNLVLSLWLAPRLGVEGVAIATLIPAIFSVAILPAYLCRRLAVPVRVLVVNSIGPGALTFLAVASAQVALGFAVSTPSWSMLIARAAATAPLALGIAAATFPAEERLEFWRLARLSRRSTPDSPAPLG